MIENYGIITAKDNKDIKVKATQPIINHTRFNSITLFSILIPITSNIPEQQFIKNIKQIYINSPKTEIIIFDNSPEQKIKKFIYKNGLATKIKIIGQPETIPLGSILNRLTKEASFPILIFNSILVTLPNNFEEQSISILPALLQGNLIGIDSPHKNCDIAIKIIDANNLPMRLTSPSKKIKFENYNLIDVYTGKCFLIDANNLKNLGGFCDTLNHMQLIMSDICIKIHYNQKNVLLSHLKYKKNSRQTENSLPTNQDLNNYLKKNFKPSKWQTISNTTKYKCYKTSNWIKCKTKKIINNMFKKMQILVQKNANTLKEK